MLLPQQFNEVAFFNNSLQISHFKKKWNIFYWYVVYIHILLKKKVTLTYVYIYTLLKIYKQLKKIVLCQY